MTTTTEWTFPRESIELVGPIRVAVDTVPVNDFEVALVPIKLRPTALSWAAPVMAEGLPYVLASNLAAGRYKLWVRYVSVPEVPVIELDAVVTVT